MKCSSCGREFDEQKYYRICPKCGTYNNVVRQDVFGQTESMPAPESDRPEPEPFVSASPAPKASGLRGLIIALAVLLILGVAEFVVSVIVVFRQEMAGGISDDEVDSWLLEDEIKETPVLLGESFAVEPDTGLGLCVESVEVVCEADTFADFPAGQKLLGIKLSSGGADVSYDTYEESPLGSLYVGYEQTFKEILEGDSFKGYRSVVGDRQDFSVWDMQYGDAGDGYVYVFVPAAVMQGTVYAEKCDPDTGRLTGIYAVDFTLGEVQ